MKKYIIIILGFISLLLCLFFIQESYAKYVSSADERATMSIARWKILVNNEDIRNNSTAEMIINPVFPGNENMAENIIAPTSEGYIDLIIDAREADVSFEYKIEVGVNENSIVKDLIATKYSIDGGNTIAFASNNKIIKNTVLHRDNNNVITIRVYIMWNDGEGSVMDNLQDTSVTNSTGKALIDVKMNFKQVV